MTIEALKTAAPTPFAVTMAAPTHFATTPEALTPFATTTATLTPFAATPATPTPFADMPATLTPFAATMAVPTHFATTPEVPTPFAATMATLKPFADTTATLTPFADTTTSPTPFADMPATLTPFADTPAMPTPFADTPSRQSPFAATPATPTPIAATPAAMGAVSCHVIKCRIISGRSDCGATISYARWAKRLPGISVLSKVRPGHGALPATHACASVHTGAFLAYGLCPAARPNAYWLRRGAATFRSSYAALRHTRAGSGIGLCSRIKSRPLHHANICHSLAQSHRIILRKPRRHEPRRLRRYRRPTCFMRAGVGALHINDLRSHNLRRRVQE